MLYLAGISISFFLCMLLLSKPGKSLADRILAAWLFVIGVHLLFFYTFLTGKIFDHPWMLGLHFPMPLMHGPFLFLYASALTGKFYRFTLKQALHFLPALISYAYLLPYFLLPDEQKILVFRNRGAGYETFLAVNIFATLISGIGYVVLTTILHRRHRRKILDEFSYTEKINLDWIQYLILGIALIWVFVLLNMDDYVFGTAVFFVLFIGYFGNKQVGIFNLGGNTPQPGPAKQPVENKPEPGQQEISATTEENTVRENENTASVIRVDFENNAADKKKYIKSGLSPAGAAELHQKLTRLMETEKTFSESELTLTGLAKKLGTHPNYLSQVINEKEGKNFYDYINTLRTDEFKRLIANPGNQKFTLLSLAFECGFNSKSSFNKYFKKMTGQSPSEYVQQLQAVAAA